jgi:hypothetical protein
MSAEERAKIADQLLAFSDGKRLGWVNAASVVLGLLLMQTFEGGLRCFDLELHHRTTFMDKLGDKLTK